MKKKLLILCLGLLCACDLPAQQIYDVCIYGATSGGVMAAYTAKKLGKSVLLIEPGAHVGGLTSGGLGYTDIGNKYAVTGLGLDFYRRMGKYYGTLESWIFEPHVAEEVFLGLLRLAKVPVLFRHRLRDVRKIGAYIKEIGLENTSGKGPAEKKISATIFIDASYEGDLMARAGVSYYVGREDSSIYHEKYAGVQVQPPVTPQHGNQIPDGVDPYKIPGDPSSGLLWGISNAKLASTGSGDKRVQAYNFRICLTDDPDNRIPISKPVGYDSSKYELLPRYIVRLTKPNDIREILKFDLMPNHKTDINNGGGFSTDMIGMNSHYPDADYAAREQYYNELKTYDQGLLYFIGHDARIPDTVRQFMLNWGYPKDEYTDNDHWTPQIYIREARRMIGRYVMTQANCERREVVNDGVGMAAYGMDSHNTQRLVMNGLAKNEGDVERSGAGPYPISYRSLTPKEEECKNLLVPVCLSASHIGYGSIRMEPVFMVLGQAAGVAASVAINEKQAVQDVDVIRIQQILKTDPLADGSQPDILIDNDDSLHVQRSGQWAIKVGGTYGPTAYYASVATPLKSIKFSAEIPKDGDYRVYTYFIPSINHVSSVTTFQVFDGKKSKEVLISKAKVMVNGQTSGEWVYLGTYTLRAGTTAAVTVSTKNSDGTVLADAVMFVPVRKNR